MSNGIQVTFDANDPAALGAFWIKALGYVEEPPPPGFDNWEAFALEMQIPRDQWDALYAIIDPDAGGPRVLFQKVPEGKKAKNRVHLDVNVGGPRGTPVEERRAKAEDKAAELEAEGAVIVERFDRPQEFWIVLKDPEGNEFCLA